MNLTALPASYGSVFTPARFSLADVGAPDGIDIQISAVGNPAPLGVKRIYSAADATLDVAPYARRMLAPVPLCDRGHGLVSDVGRSVSCFVSAVGFSSPYVVLCGGVEPSPVCTLLSAAPSALVIRPGERDEMSVVSGDRVEALVTFRRGSVVYTDSSLGARNIEGMLTAVVDPAAVCAAYTRLSGGPADELGAFAVRFRFSQQGYTSRIVERRYTIDRAACGGRRLAWFNRFGAIDYHTFPVVESVAFRGDRTVVSTAAASRTVGTSHTRSERLLSDPCDEATAGWLSEIFSSPAVWVVDGALWTPVDVSSGTTIASRLSPSVVEVVVTPGVSSVSRKL